MSVGFIGLGNMGAHMARNLIRSGASVIAFDLDSNKLGNLKKFGAEIAKDPSEIGSACSNIITMLPSSAHVKDVFTSSNGLLRTLNPGTLCIDSSTIDQDVTIEIADMVENKGGRYVDAPVSGGVLGAEKGTLTFMVGGDESSYEKASDILKRMGTNILHCGKVGSGQAAKICNNMLLAIEMVGVAETMNLGIRMGLDAKTLANVLNTSSGRCWSSDTYNPVPHVIENIPSSNHYEGGFICSLMAKDLGLSQNAATSTRTPIPLGSSAHQIYRILAKIPQYEKRDFSVIYQFLKDHLR